MYESWLIVIILNNFSLSIQSCKLKLLQINNKFQFYVMKFWIYFRKKNRIDAININMILMKHI